MFSKIRIKKPFDGRYIRIIITYYITEAFLNLLNKKHLQTSSDEKLTGKKKRTRSKLRQQSVPPPPKWSANQNKASANQNKASSDQNKEEWIPVTASNRQQPNVSSVRSRQQANVSSKVSSNVSSASPLTIGSPTSWSSELTFHTASEREDNEDIVVANEDKVLDNNENDIGNYINVVDNDDFEEQMRIAVKLSLEQQRRCVSALCTFL